MKFTIVLSLTLIFSNTQAGTTCLKNAANYDLPAGSTNGPNAVAYFPNNAFLAAIGSEVTVFEVAEDGALSNAASYPLPDDISFSSALAISPDGKYLVSGSDSTIAVFKITNGALSPAKSYTLPEGSSGADAMAFSSDGTYLAVANHSTNNVTLFTVAKNGVLSQPASYALPSGSGPTDITFSPNNNYLATANYDSSNITLFKVTNDGLSKGLSYKVPSLSNPSLSTNPSSVAFSPNSKYLAVAANGNSVTLFNVSKRGALTNMQQYETGESSAISTTFSPNGNFLAVANLYQQYATLFDVVNGKLQKASNYAQPGNSQDPSWVTFSPDGSHVAIANSSPYSKSVTIFDVDTCSKPKKKK